MKDEYTGVAPLKRGRGIDNKAKQLLIDYMLESVDLADLPEDFKVYICLKRRALSNYQSIHYQYVLKTNLPDTRLYVVVYETDLHCWHLDEYECINSKMIPANF